MTRGYWCNNPECAARGAMPPAATVRWRQWDAEKKQDHEQVADLCETCAPLVAVPLGLDLLGREAEPSGDFAFSEVIE